jgi:hypothetical protein
MFVDKCVRNGVGNGIRFGTNVPMRLGGSRDCISGGKQQKR